MASPLAGSLAKTIAKAVGSIFLPATLTRGTSIYACKAIFDLWGKYPGPSFLLTGSEYRVLIPAYPLPIEPRTGDVITLQGQTVVVLSMGKEPAVSTDPARAMWTLICAGYPVQTGLSTGYGGVAQAIGLPFSLYRSAASNPIVAGNLVEVLPAVFTPAKATGFSFTKNVAADDVTWAVLADASQLQVGDYMVGASTYFIAAMPPLLDVVAVLCNRVAAIVRPGEALSATGGIAPALPSQQGSTGTYFGVSTAIAGTALSSGELPIISGIPCAMVGTTGRATGTGELPTDSPGPSRWRIYLPQSACPKGSIKDHDVITDEEGSRYQVSAADWTPLGYRVEAVRLEN